MPFIKYQKRHIFDELGMVSTTYFDPKNTPANTAHGYINTKADGASSTDNDTAGKTIKVDNSNSSQWQQYDYGEETFFATRPDGGIYSTIRDLRLWEKALKEYRIISKEMLLTAYTPHITVTGSTWSTYQNRPNTSYGLGWFIDNTPGYPTKVYHTGDNGGFQAYLGKFPQKDVTVIILENRNDNDRWSLVKTIDEILLNAGIL
jgi:CubicO group peptidase (beta-lactamase class C family)